MKHRLIESETNLVITRDKLQLLEKDMTAEQRERHSTTLVPEDVRATIGDTLKENVEMQEVNEKLEVEIQTKETVIKQLKVEKDELIEENCKIQT